MILFKKIKIKNLLSFGNTPSELMLDGYKLTSVSGPNASGKSSFILDSLSFALFGKPFRQITVHQLVNNKNKKDLLVELYFSKNNNEFVIKRGLRPNVFEIYQNGSLINQDAAAKDYQNFLEEVILGFNSSIFRHVIVLGKTSYTAFFKLPLGERRKFIESVLDLNIFSSMSELNKDRISKIKLTFQKLKEDSLVLETRIKAIQKNIHDINAEYLRVSLIQERETTEKRDSLSKKIEAIQNEIDELQKKKHPVNNVGNYYNKLNELSRLKIQLKEKQDTVNKEFSSLENYFCPTCKKPFTEDEKADRLIDLENKLSKYQGLQKELDIKIDYLNAIFVKIEFNNELDQQVEELKRNRSFLYKDLAILDNIKKPDNELIKKKEQELQKEQDLFKVLQEQKDDITKKYMDLETLAGILRDDGLKSVLISQYLPSITNVMNKHLSDLGLFVVFKLNDTFKESFFVKGFDPLDYDSFSEGEKLRIDLAIILTWREICYINTNIIVFDEMDGSIDGDGISALFEILRKKRENIIIISHSLDRYGDIFDRKITVTKERGFSSISY